MKLTMTYKLRKPFPRLWEIDFGKVMVVTDLHGDWEAYQSYRDRFLVLRADQQADYLVFTGDLIHRRTEDILDQSLEIVLDMLELQKTLGDAVIYLCGNHEMPHVYGFGLSKGQHEYTPGFEARLSQSGQRERVIGLFHTLPFYLRTRAGVSLTHAGAFGEVEELENLDRLFTWDHQALLDKTDALLQKEDVAALRRAYTNLSQADSYEALAKHYLAISGVADPRYNDLLRGAFVGHDPYYTLLYSALFTKCEDDYGLAYNHLVNTLLGLLSKGYATQEVLVAGHMNCTGGYKIIGDRHFRLASGSHAKPREAGQYLLFDASQKMPQASELLACLYSIY